jgi:hypothetical protein
VIDPVTLEIDTQKTALLRIGKKREA